jgi:cellulose synthase/poly-beta-1,6-N-acetylglucosamine synthase-like glycosyltransferase
METLFLTTLFTTSAIYVVQTVLIYLGTQRLNYPRSKDRPTVTVLVAMMDEEATLGDCVDSLLAQDYPHEQYEIILINDRSTDRTGALIEQYRYHSDRIKTLHLSEGITGLSGKASAIARGIELATGEIILVTDGDCRIPRSWVQTHVSYYRPQVGLVGGFTILDEKNDNTPFFGRIQSLDWTYLLSIGSGAIGYGVPLSVLGNNFSFRKQAYDEVGGYRKIGFTIIEDFALMRKLVRETAWEVIYPIDRKMLVYSYPMRKIRDFHRQRKRWSAGGKEMGLYGKFLMAIAFLAHALILTGLMLEPFRWESVSIFAALCCSDLWLLHRTTTIIGRRDLLKYLPAWKCFYFFYTLFFAPILLLPTTVTWKDIRYSWKLDFQMKKIET